MNHTTSNIDAVEKAAEDDYNNLRHIQFITEFKAEFDARLLTYAEHRNLQLSDNQIAMDFLYSLDKSRYSSFI